jgi:salicylate hydroxylase
VTVCEQHANQPSTGAGLQLGANALRVFDYLGLLDQIMAVAVAPEKVLFRDYVSGVALYDMPLGERYRQRYGLPYLHIHRADLLHILLKEMTRDGTDNVRFNVRVKDFIESREDVTVLFEDGNQARCDLLVAADGIRSACRRRITGDNPPRFTGNMAWRATVPTHSLPPRWMDTIASNFVGPDKHVVLYYLRKRELANFVGVVEREHPANNSWVSRGSKQELRADFDGWHPTVQEIIDTVPENECYCWDLYDHLPLSNWSSQRVTLLGDAAHATLPFMASGAAMAIEDARILQRSLDQAASVADALMLYQNNRKARTAKVQQLSARFGKIYHIQQAWMRRLAFSGIRVLGPSKEEFLPAYDPNQIPLT